MHSHLITRPFVWERNFLRERGGGTNVYNSPKYSGAGLLLHAVPARLHLTGKFFCNTREDLYTVFTIKMQ